MALRIRQRYHSSILNSGWMFFEACHSVIKPSLQTGMSSFTGQDFYLTNNSIWGFINVVFYFFLLKLSGF